MNYDFKNINGTCVFRSFVFTMERQTQLAQNSMLICLLMRASHSSWQFCLILEAMMLLKINKMIKSDSLCRFACLQYPLWSSYRTSCQLECMLVTEGATCAAQPALLALHQRHLSSIIIITISNQYYIMVHYIIQCSYSLNILKFFCTKSEFWLPKFKDFKTLLGHLFMQI